MMRALYTASTGMDAQTKRIDTISNNLANVNTTGYKKTLTEFEDLLYASLRSSGTTDTQGNRVPTGIQVGHGVKFAATEKIFSQGNFEQTEKETDMVIEGRGFFQIADTDGEIKYTRAGSFKIDDTGRFVTNNGLPLEPQVTVPDGTETISISQDGVVSFKIAGQTEPATVQLTLARFINPAGLKAIGDTLFEETPASGPPTISNPTEDSMGAILQGFVEGSNVQIVEEMVNLIEGQRAYESNSKSIQTADSMLQTAVGLKR